MSITTSPEVTNPTLPDLTVVTTVVACKECGLPATTERFAFASDADLVGKVIHFSCAVATINQ